MGTTNQKGIVISLNVEADMSSNQYKLMKIGTADDTCTVATAVTDSVAGVLLNKPDASGKTAQIQVSGIAEIVAGDAVTRGVMQKMHATNGTIADTGADGDVLIGLALNSAATGKRAKVLLFLNAQQAS